MLSTSCLIHLFQFLILKKKYIYLGVFVHMCMPQTYTWRSEGNFQETVFSFHRWVLGVEHQGQQTWVVKCSYLLSPLTGFQLLIFHLYCFEVFFLAPYLLKFEYFSHVDVTQLEINRNYR